MRWTRKYHDPDSLGEAKDQGVCTANGALQRNSDNTVRTALELEGKSRVRWSRKCHDPTYGGTDSCRAKEQGVHTANGDADNSY